MRVPPFSRYRHLMRFVAIFLCGMIVGSAVYNGFFHLQFTHLTNINSDLRAQIEQYKDDIEALNKYKNQHTSIRKIQVYIIKQANEKDQIDLEIENELKKQIREDLQIFLGRDMFKISSDAKFASELIKHKVYKDIHDQDFKIQIRTMLVNDGLLQIWVDAKRHDIP
ncbi:hypothetical protein [Paenibacillus terrigena]|uniref:hypothetical protein n=1 Tax=Paenibacillus terrigena TaxID=369333 RepID=UPI0003645823|nr:hypothetical protein [Paenibacillus terrigena]